MTDRHLEGRDEPIVDPALPIIDTHHHLFIRPGISYMLSEYLADVGAGHDIRASVYVETRFMSRPDGPEVLRPLGEIEFANGIGAMGASGFFGPCRVAAAIVGHADLSLGAGVGVLLDRALAAAPDRFRGVRQITMTHSDPRVFGHLASPPPQGVMQLPGFRTGFRELAPRGLSFDAAILHHQLPELIELADEHPDTVIVLNHMGLALNLDPSDQARAVVFAEWRRELGDLARRPNVVCKIGGLGSSYWGFGFDTKEGPATSTQLAETWRPWVETAVAAFGPDRCMLESNYPPDGRSCGFVPLWNALKLCLQGYSEAEKAAIAYGTAARVYRIAM
jgi:L-fuconolactonase